jgi:precorrin-6A/cobalt-precorrin-6A reductase
MHQDAPRLWLISGTGEGPALAERLLALGWHLTVSLVSAPAALAYRPHPGLSLRVGALGGDSGVVAELAGAEACGLPYAVVVDASHPFACLVSRQLAAVCGARGQRLLRLRRPNLEGPAILLPGLEDLRRVPLVDQPLLLAIGARQLAVAVACSPGARHHARLLPSPSALQQAMAAGLAPERVACLRPGSGLEVEQALVRRWQITTVLARQSGGSTEQLWRRICGAEGLQLLLLSRPPEPAGVEVHGLEALLEVLAALRPASPISPPASRPSQPPR